MQLAKGRLAPHWRQPAGRMRLVAPTPPALPANSVSIVYMYSNERQHLAVRA